MDVCRRIIEARGDDAIVRIEDVAVGSVGEAARRFGLSDHPEAFVEVLEEEAAAVLAAVLSTDMAYHCPIVPLAEAERLARAFLDVFAGSQPRFYTNGDFAKLRSAPGTWPAWFPVTDATFDTGVLVLAQGRVGCAWFMDED